MTDHPLGPLADRIGIDVDDLLARIAGSDHLCGVIADALTRGSLKPDGSEHLLAPPNQISPLACRFAASKMAVTVRYPEPHETMRATVKALGWHWDGIERVWAFSLNAFNGPAADRLVEAACALLAAGFIVSVPSAELARRVEAGDYQPEQERWITKAVAGKHAGWFVISWGRKDDLYKPAVNIHGARYIGGCVAAPPESYDEVLDFAQEYEYSLSEGARKLAEEARQRVAQIAVVQPPALHQRKRLRDRGSSKPVRLAAVEEAKIDDELLDTDD